VTRPALNPCRIAATKTSTKVGINARIRAEAQTMLMPTASKARFQRSARDLAHDAGERAKRKRESDLPFVQPRSAS
jgi:hypothetical protein